MGKKGVHVTQKKKKEKYDEAANLTWNLTKYSI